MSSWYTGNPYAGNLRLGDAERKAALRDLRRQHARGRIDSAELEERSDAVRTARTHGDLGPVFADLRPLLSPRPRLYRRAWLPFPLLPFLLIGAIVLAVTGHFPWVPLIVLAVVLVVFLPRRRHWGHWRGGPRGWAC